MGRREEAPVGQDDGPLDGVRQLPDVAGPGVARQGGLGVAAQPRLALAELDAERLHEVLGQAEDVLAPLAQRGEVHAEDVQAVVEVRAERARRHRLRQVPVGGGDEADVGPARRGAPHALVLVLLEHPEELGLDTGRQLADLVQEERPPGGQLEAAGRGPCRRR